MSDNSIAVGDDASSMLAFIKAVRIGWGGVGETLDSLRGHITG